ncbi:MAG: ATP-grasp fold amidoligase family protein [Eggerthella lenta]
MRNVYDESWNLLEVDLGRPHDPSVVMEKPDNLDELIFVARKLSEDFPFVRVDLYNLNESIIFGELTWIPMGGNCIISPLSFDREMGSWLDIPNWHDPIETKRQVQEPTR